MLRIEPIDFSETVTPFLFVDVEEGGVVGANTRRELCSSLSHPRDLAECNIGVSFVGQRVVGLVMAWSWH